MGDRVGDLERVGGDSAAVVVVDVDALDGSTVVEVVAVRPVPENGKINKGTTSTASRRSRSTSARPMTAYSTATV